jgi:hypothetical protein
VARTGIRSWKVTEVEDIVRNLMTIAEEATIGIRERPLRRMENYASLFSLGLWSDRMEPRQAPNKRAWRHATQGARQTA